MRPIKIEQKLTSCFALVLGMIAILSWTAFHGLSSMNDRFDVAVDVTAKKIGLAGEINMAVGDMLAAQRGMLLYTTSKNASEVTKSKKLFADRVVMIQKDITELGPMLSTNQERQTLAVLVRDNAQWRGTFAEMERLCSMGDVPAANRLEIDRATPLYHELDLITDVLEDSQWDLLREDKAREARALAGSRAILFLVFALALFLSLLAMVVVRRISAALERGQREARESLAEIEQVYKYSPVGLSLRDRELRFLRINETLARFNGVPSEEHIGRTIHDLFPDVAERDVETTRAVLERGEAVLNEEYHRHSPGDPNGNDFLVNHYPYKSESGEIVGIMSSVVDITARKQAEWAVNEARALAQSTIDALLSTICVLDEAGTIIAVNQAWRAFAAANARTDCDVTPNPPGARSGSGEGLNYLGVCERADGPGADDGSAFASGLRAVLNGERGHFELEYPCHAPWERRWFQAKATRFSLNGLPRVVVEHLNITKRKEAEETLRRSEAEFRTLFNTVNDGIFIICVSDGRFLEVNDVACHRLGYSRAELLDLSATQIDGDPNPKFASARIGELMERGEILFQTSQIRNDGSRIPVEISFRQIEYRGIAAGLAVVRDITERKAAETRLQDAKKAAEDATDRLNLATRAGGVGIWDLDIVTGRVTWDDQMFRLRGLTPDRLCDPTKAFPDTLHPEDRQRLSETLATALRDGTDVDLDHTVVWPDGSIHHIHAVSTVRRDGFGKPLQITGTNWDITARKASAAELQKFASIAENTSDFIGMATLDGQVSFVNPAGRLTLGLEQDEQVSNKSILDFVMQQEKERFQQKILPIVFRDGRWDGESQFRHFRTGQPIPMWQSLFFVTEPGTDRKIAIVTVCRDITFQKLAQAELVNAKEMAEAANLAKSEFLANMSHEIRTPMNGVIGMTGLLLDTDLMPLQRHYAEVCRDSGESLLRLINDILDFSKIEANKLELESVDFHLQDLLDNLMATVAAQANAKGLALTVSVDPDVPGALLGDPGRLRQIMTNLLANAIKFTQAGHVALRVSLQQPGQKPGEPECLLRISVRDTGMGIPADKIGILFEKFSQVEASTTRNFGGTGLGLAISKQLAERMGGEMGVASEVGKGSEFWFTARLGRSNQPVKRDASAERPLPATWATARILIADDNVVNQEVALGLLKALGLRADAVANGAEAIKSLASIPYDLVLMDVRMPVMDGIEASRQIRNPNSAVLDHDIPIIALTANAMQSDRDLCMEAGMNGFVAKPISKGLLRQALEQWLRRGKSEHPVSTAQAGDNGTAGNEDLLFDRPGMMHRLEGDEELAEALMSAFVEGLPSNIQQLKASLESGDAPGVGRLAHSIKGAAACVGGERLRHAALEMENAADAGDLGTVSAQMDSLESQFVQLKEAMTEPGNAKQGSETASRRAS
jgi:PAS domain S-box-containing protein